MPHETKSTRPETPSRGPGRPRIHADAAARQRAWRERLAAAGKQEKRAEDKTSAERTARYRERRQAETAAWKRSHDLLLAPDATIATDILRRFLESTPRRHDTASALVAAIKALELAPYRLAAPTIISFSGGRTSAFLLRKVLDAHDGTLPPDVHVLFANTGKERPETLDFVQECSERWHVPVTWLEFDPNAPHQTRIVDHATASRNGEPFEAAIRTRGYLPNPVSRYCTVLLKIRRMVSYARDVLGWKRWDSVLGLRADEADRVARLTRSSETTRERPRAPLAVAGVTKEDVVAWWQAQPFDLRLPSTDGVTLLGNCDLCFLKRASTIRALIADQPELAAWWARAEQTARPKTPDGARFRLGRATYTEMLAAAAGRQQLEAGGEDEGGDVDCHCHD